MLSKYFLVPYLSSGIMVRLHKKLKSDEKLENWQNISEWLDDAGYKNQSIKVSSLDLSPDKAVVNITNINI